MPLYLCIVFDDYHGMINLGIFSDREKAETQAHVYMQGVGELFEEVDRDINGDIETIWYQTIHDRVPYTATIEEFRLNELSY